MKIAFQDFFAITQYAGLPPLAHIPHVNREENIMRLSLPPPKLAITSARNSLFAPAFSLPFLACLIAGLSWDIHAPAGPWLALILPVAVPFGQRWWVRLLAAAAYYLAGTISMLPSFVGFFGEHALIAGFIAWAGSSALLALPWIMAGGPIGVLAAVLINAVPPLGLIGWLSPLTAAGVLFPGTGLAGLALCLLLIMALGAVAHYKKSAIDSAFIWIVVPFALGSFIGCITTFEPPGPPDGWVGVDTKIQPSAGDVMKAIQNNARVIKAALDRGKGKKIVVLPEAVLDDWGPGTQMQFAAAVPKGQIWLIGAETQAPGDRWDAVVMVQHGQAEEIPVFRAALPMPLSMWRPGDKNSYRAAWWEPAKIIDGQRVWAAICYDQVLPWVWVEGMIQQPDIVLVISNSWWAKGWNPAPHIQKAQADAWMRLIGIPAVYASNS